MLNSPENLHGRVPKTTLWKNGQRDQCSAAPSLQLRPNNDLHHFQGHLPYKQLYGKRVGQRNGIR